MRNALLAVSALTVLSSFGLLAGCAGAGGSPFAGVSPAGERTAFAPSWMAADAQRRDLLYVSDLYNDHVNVYSYPQGKLEGVLTGFQAVHYECVDSAGNVFIANGGAKSCWSMRTAERSR